MAEVEKPQFVLLAAVLVFAAAMALYASVMPREFLWDDTALVGRNTFVQRCSNLGRAVNPANLLFVLPVQMSARPVVNATLIADSCSGRGPAGMYLTNALIHAFNAVLVLLLIFTLSGSALPALFGALIFALHPAAVEPVKIIVFRSHLLGFFFFNAGLLAAIFHAKERKPALAAAAAACYLLAMLSIESAVVLPAAALAAAYFVKGREGVKKAGPLMAVLAAAAIFYFWFRTPRSGYSIAGISSPGIITPSLFYPRALFPEAATRASSGLTILPWRQVYENPLTNLYTMAGVLLDYFKALLLPVGLSLDYSPAPITRFSDGILPVAASLAAAAAAILLFLRRRLEGLGLVLLLTALLPAMNIWPIYNIKADRYLYLPLAGFSIAAAAAVRRLPSSAGAARLLAAAAVLWLGGLAFLSTVWSRNFDTNFSLFSAVVKRQPAVSRARANLSSAYLEAGNCAAALEQEEEAVRLDNNPQQRLRLAFTLVLCRKPEAALKETETVLKALPRETDALYLAGLLLYRTDRRAARVTLEKALLEDPSHRDARLTLILFGDKKAEDLAPRDKRNVERLRTFYRDCGLL